MTDFHLFSLFFFYILPSFAVARLFLSSLSISTRLAACSCRAANETSAQYTVLLYSAYKLVYLQNNIVIARKNKKKNNVGKHIFKFLNLFLIKCLYS